MPQATDLTIANGAAVNKTFALLVPAAGDGGIAHWALKEGAISSVFPVLTASATKKATSRSLKVKFRLPSSFVDASTGMTHVGESAEFNGTYVIPDNFPESMKADFAAFVKNALSTALLVAMAKDGLPAT